MHKLTGIQTLRTNSNCMTQNLHIISAVLRFVYFDFLTILILWEKQVTH